MPFGPLRAALSWPDSDDVVLVQDQMVYLVLELSWQGQECCLFVLAAVGSRVLYRLRSPSNLISSLVLVNVIGGKYLFVFLKTSFTVGLDDSATFLFFEGAMMFVVCGRIQRKAEWVLYRWRRRGSKGARGA